VIFLEWMEWLRKPSKVSGEYIESTTWKSLDSGIFIRPVWRCSRSGKTPYTWDGCKSTRLSLPSVSEEFGHPSLTIHNCMVQRLQLVNQLLRWVPC
jgi:hypothetical protein